MCSPRSRPIIGVCATGILIRMLAPFLISKESDPPVLAVAEDGSVVVPLLGGHHGANALAVRLADVLGATAALTTASDVTLRVPLDAPPAGWRLREKAGYKRVAAELLAGAAARIVVESGPEPDWLLALPQADDAPITILVSDRADAEADLVYAPQTVVLGLGCERLAEESEVWALVVDSLAKANIAKEAVACVASIALKAAEPAMHGVARRLGVPARFFDAARLERETPRLEELRPTWSFARPAAMASRRARRSPASARRAISSCPSSARSARPAPSRARRRSSIRISSAARAARLPSSASAPARRRRARTRSRPRSARRPTWSATSSISTCWGRWPSTRRGTATSWARRRCACASPSASRREGRDVALVCSGDAGIYAMATLVFELIDREGNADWARVEIRGLPGVSAMQTAAAPHRRAARPRFLRHLA